AVEDRQDVGEFVVRDEVNRFPDLTLARLTIAHDAVDTLVQIILARCNSQAGGDRKTLAKRPGRGIEEWKAFHRIRMTIDHRVVGSECHEIIFGHRAPYH